MKRLKKLVSILAVGGIVAVVLLPANGSAAAQQKPTITISPFLREVRFSSEDATKDFNVEITNSTSQTQNFNLSVLDFGSLNDSGGIVFAGSNASTLIKKYGLASWLQLSQKSLSLGPRQSTEVGATIINDTTLTPGGHYAAIIASINSFGSKSGNEININQQLSSLILATKVGGEKYDMRLDKISSDGSLVRLPKNVTLSFSNPGNVHVVPRGKVTLQSISGKVIAQGIINEESSYILPESSRTYQIKLDRISSSEVLPTMYHVQVDYRYDGLDNYARKDQFLYSFNVPSLIGLIIIIVQVIWIIHRVRSRITKKN